MTYKANIFKKSEPQFALSYLRVTVLLLLCTYTVKKKMFILKGNFNDIYL